MLANPFKTRIIAEAQIKTDKVDARILADLLRARLVSSVDVFGRETRQIKEVLGQRCFFVRQRTMLRNRIHRLLGGQHEVKLPQCSDLFGRKGVGFLEKLELPAPTRLLLTRQLALLKELAVRIREDEETLEELLQESPAFNYVRSLPGMGPILAAVICCNVVAVCLEKSCPHCCGWKDTSRKLSCESSGLLTKWFWRTDDGRTTLLCGAGHTDPCPFMTIRSRALHYTSVFETQYERC